MKLWVSVLRVHGKLRPEAQLEPVPVEVTMSGRQANATWCDGRPPGTNRLPPLYAAQMVGIGTYGFKLRGYERLEDGSMVCQEWLCDQVKQEWAPKAYMPTGRPAGWTAKESASG